MTNNEFIVAVNSLSFPYVEEYAASIAVVFNAKLEVFDANKAYIIDKSKRYIFVSVLPYYLANQTAPEIRSKWFLVNVDQLVTRITMNRYNHIKTMQRFGIRVLNYADDLRLKRDLGLDLEIIPCPISRTDRYHLMHLMKDAQMIYDVAFCGELSDRRKSVVDALSNKGLRVIHAQGWQLDRDLQIASAKILLNIHTFEDYRMYECLRCDRWAAAGKVVVSEDSVVESLGVDNHGSRHMIIESPYDKLVDTIIDVLNNYDHYRAQLMEYLRLNLAELIVKREKALVSVVTKG